MPEQRRRTSGDPNVTASPASQYEGPLSAQPLDNTHSHILLDIYSRKRLQDQISFYRSRVREFDANSGFMVGAGAFIMAISSFVSAIGAFFNSPALALVTAILPAFASLIASFRQLYQWDKQAGLYRDAALGLEEVMLVIPDDDVYDPRVAELLLPRLVQRGEEVFVAEINQWGQIAMGKDAEDDELSRALKSLTSEQLPVSVGGGSSDPSPAGSGPSRSPSSNTPPSADAFPAPPPQEFDDGGTG